jgi:hypothetical protein
MGRVVADSSSAEEGLAVANAQKIQLEELPMRMMKFILAAGLLLAAAPMFATTLAVGTCLPQYTSFSTISLAVAAAPISGSTTIDVCPGTYPEQVVITKRITLKGVLSGNSNAAIITAPGGALATNATSTYGGIIQAQVLVQNTTATIEDLTLDATSTNLTSCADNPIGIFFQNASGIITRNSVLNDIQPAGYTGCQGGLGIYVESGATTVQPNPSPAGTSTVSVTYNNVAGYQKNGITGNASGTTVTITGNVVVGQGPWNGAGQNSIQIAFGAGGSISTNTVGSDVWAPDVFGDTGDAAAGILVYGSSNIPITSNVVSNTQYGIAVVSDGVNGNGATVNNNTITLTHLYDAIDLCSNGNSAANNKITGADESGIHFDDTCTGAATGNSATSNTISGTCAGILVGPTAAGSNATNTFYNAVYLELTGVDTCTPAPTGGVRKAAAKPSGRPHPFPSL